MNDLIHNKLEMILASQIQCVLATCNNNIPTQHLMAYAYSMDLKQIHFASLLNTQKVRNIQKNNCVSIIWDNRTGNSTDHNDGLLLTGNGVAVIESSTKDNAIKEDFLRRNPSLKTMIDHSDCIFISVTMDTYKLVEGQEVLLQVQTD